MAERQNLPEPDRAVKKPAKGSRSELNQAVDKPAKRARTATPKAEVISSQQQPSAEPNHAVEKPAKSTKTPGTSKPTPVPEPGATIPLPDQTANKTTKRSKAAPHSQHPTPPEPDQPVEKPAKRTKTAGTSKPTPIPEPEATIPLPDQAVNKTTKRSKAAKTPKAAPHSQYPTPPEPGPEVDLEWLRKERMWFNRAQKKDNLKLLPTKATSVYMNSRGQTTFDDRYVMRSQRKKPIGHRHPKIIEAEKKGTITPGLRAYYEQMDPKTNMPLAGIPKDEMMQVDWTEDDSIESGSVRLYSRETSADSATGVLGRRSPSPIAMPEDTAEAPLPQDSSDDSLSTLIQEENFYNRPSVKIPVPDHVKSLLVDDWENVTKNQQLVPLPHVHPADEILDDYLAHERPNRQPGSASMDVLEETIAGLRDYFDKALGRILLYRFERPQYHDMHQLWHSANSKNKSAKDTYGAEHMARLLVTLPELIAQTNMDQQSVNRLREELIKFTNWFSRHVAKYFVPEYETPDADYIEKVKNF
ncbi:MRG-domain-containing protein [Achaetomium macrosporum]|uniref:Chromatin modification-related protein EAF3 n=1 Tax=Achaetomium macrosporum TaxID=79813 RepID=A0AAN7CJT5_9PEZI|nr:MRG-domain-containing protein [Achaetomium macrosporum]